MPRVLLINPNSTETMTASMLASARAVAPSVDFTGWTSRAAPAAIQGPDDGRRAEPPLLKLVARAGARFDCIIIGCFDDTGLAAASDLAECPVLGIGQAAFCMAMLRGLRFSVVTTLPVSVPVIEENIRRYGMAPWLDRVRASELSVLETEGEGAAPCDTIAREAELAIAEDESQCIILGCGGMSRLAAEVRARVSVPVIDGVEAAARLSSALT
ncbi:allantoin racemase [Aliiruegeria haliotis]|uniref:Allantoin racemase n=1 Tax=Aliiruegeria haliotis TaxID=1280846 RepID=A0A2T0RYR5_9RHOB|nr:aspartate/glutamate racemase family protein [Aliiruegeria haliotis]PRY26308.1 allantoin racemase [Aliiruegeria haliotis]